MRIVLVGPPGAGKGTQAERLARRVGVAHVATGDILRAAVAAETDAGRRATPYVRAGELVPDDVVLAVIRERLAQPDAAAGFVLDGFPRNGEQAEALDRLLEEFGTELDAVVVLEVPDEVIVSRLSRRALCPSCGRVYSRENRTALGRCEACGAALVERTDDRPEVIAKRLEVFREKSEPIVARYEERGYVVRANGVGTRDEVSERIAAAIQGVETIA